jgi:hypothetical protein
VAGLPAALGQANLSPRRHFEPFPERHGGFPGYPVLFPLLLVGGLDPALCLFPQHPITGKLYLGCNILAKEKCVTFANVRYWDCKQQCA